MDLALTTHDASAVRAADAMRVVAVGREAAFSACERKTVRARGHERLAGRRVTFVIVVTVFLVREHAVLVVTA